MFGQWCTPNEPRLTTCSRAVLVPFNSCFRCFWTTDPMCPTGTVATVAGQALSAAAHTKVSRNNQCMQCYPACETVHNDQHVVCIYRVVITLQKIEELFELKIIWHTEYEEVETVHMICVHKQ